MLYHNDGPGQKGEMSLSHLTVGGGGEKTFRKQFQMSTNSLKGSGRGRKNCKKEKGMWAWSQKSI